MIKEYHLKYYSEAHAVKETYILADLMHESLPKLHAIFFADSSLFMVCLNIFQIFFLLYYIYFKTLFVQS